MSRHANTFVYFWTHCYLKTENLQEWTGLLACLVLYQVPMLCFPSMAAQVSQFIRRFEREHVPPIFTQILSVIWQTHCSCKKTCSSLQEKSPCQTVSLVASFAATTFVGSWAADIFMSLEHVCSPWLFGDAVCPRCKSLWQQKCLQLPGAWVQWHFPAGYFGWCYSERRLHFGRRRLILLAYINFCWLISAMQRNLRQLRLTSDWEPALHWAGCSYDVSQARNPDQPTAGRCSHLMIWSWYLK